MLGALECVLVGLGTHSSCFSDLPKSMLGGIDVLNLVVASEALEAFSGVCRGSASGNVVVEGDWSRDDGTDTTTGDETVVVGLPVTLAGLTLFRAPSTPSLAGSLTPTDAFSRLYSPLSPPCTSSIAFASPSSDSAGGAVSSSKVVSVSEREAVACI
jgi:hypothetical protein